MGQQKRKIIKVSDVARLAPPVDPVEARRKNLQHTLLSSVSELDVQEITGTLLAKAKQGDMRAINTVLNLLQGGGGQRQTAQQPVVVGDEQQVEDEALAHQPSLVLTGGGQLTQEEILHAQRIEVADIIRRDGPKSRGYLGATIRVDLSKIQEILSCDWFEQRTGHHDSWGLTQKGWTATKEEN